MFRSLKGQNVGYSIPVYFHIIFPRVLHVIDQAVFPACLTQLISDNCSEYQTIHIPVNNPLYGEFQIYCNDPEVHFGSPDVQVQCRIVYSTDCSFRL